MSEKEKKAAKVSPSREKKSRSATYDEPLKVDGSFMDIVKAAGKNRATKVAPPKKK